ncbi:Dabb family protein [Salegentibacter sp. JZCK2]|uniref:Dabb family protein n=1 Tax=Salegentibacter tibetensis TaxID=2873600 RepID=UPI001CCEB535|nr:Dabb family protein [Salegentibacter tibetensis]MBZ9729890.1 Dabb family protein [Salegentibacter tibetensis]
MKKSIFLKFSLFLALISCEQSKNNQESTDRLVNHPNATEQTEQVLRHVVLFKFKDSATETDIQEIIDAFRSLPNKIDGILNFEWGTDVSPEGLSDGFTHCFFLTFKDEKSRDEYLPHPAHEAFGDIVGPHLDKVLVIDYWPKP